ncbi:glycosyltransferase [Terrabacter sp. 2RAF25]|uniref:glycosyltransferase n=1 Tax=Terrabacter sp. 2RAF25 TaxID=3232998 RepID=UPI003F9DB961
MTRILLLSNIFPSEANPAAGTFVKARIRALEDLGVSVDAVGVGARGRRVDGRKAAEFIDATVTASHFQRLALRGRAVSRTLERETAVAISSALDLTRYDGVMAHGMFSLGAGSVAAVLLEKHGLPFTVHLHGSDINTVMPRNPAATARVLETATASLFVSKALLARARELGYSGGNSVVTGNGVELDTFRLASKRPRIAGELHLIFVGNLLPVKGADRLPEVFEAVRKRHPSVSLTVVGDGPLRGDLEQRLAGRRVTFVGRVSPERVATLVGEADVTVLPSRSEGWPTVINESYAVGTPVVGVDVGGVAEALIDPRWAVTPGKAVIENLALVAELAAAEAVPEVLRRRASEFEWSRIARAELDALMKDLP